MEDQYLQKGESYKRLLNDYKKHGSLFIGYDFDGTVHDFHNEGVTYPRTIALLRDLKSIGCKLICWTAYEDLNYVKTYLEKNDIPFDGINEGGIPLPWASAKPFFSALLDDRAGLVQVFGELSMLIKEIKEHNEIKEGQTLKCIKITPLPGNKIAPPLVLNAEYVCKSVHLDSKENPHIDVGLPMEYEYVTSYETKEVLPPSTHWCHPTRFIILK